MVECIRHRLAGGSEGEAADALYGVLLEIERLGMDLDVHAWGNRDGEAHMEAANR